MRAIDVALAALAENPSAVESYRDAVAGSRREPACQRRLAVMSDPARELPADSQAVVAAVENARHGAITHLTIAGERVAAIVPESLIEALRAAEDAEDTAEADAAWDEPGESVPWNEVKAEFDL